MTAAVSAATSLDVLPGAASQVLLGCCNSWSIFVKSIQRMIFFPTPGVGKTASNSTNLSNCHTGGVKNDLRVCVTVTSAHFDGGIRGKVE